MNPLIQLRKATPVFLVALACFGLSPMAQALLPPPAPDGGYPNANTAERKVCRDHDRFSFRPNSIGLTIARLYTIILMQTGV